METPQNGWIDVELSFNVTVAVAVAYEELCDSYDDGVDNTAAVVLIPFPVLQAMKQDGFDTDAGPYFRTIRTVDRITKVVSSSRFCK